MIRTSIWRPAWVNFSPSWSRKYISWIFCSIKAKHCAESWREISSQLYLPKIISKMKKNSWLIQQSTTWLEEGMIVVIPMVNLCFSHQDRDCAWVFKETLGYWINNSFYCLEVFPVHLREKYTGSYILFKEVEVVE